MSFPSPWSRQVFLEELTREWAHVDIARAKAAYPMVKGAGDPSIDQRRVGTLLPFWQLGAEVIGVDDPDVDVEMIALMLDWLTHRMRNGASAQKIEIFVPYSKLKAEVVRIFKNEGYISDYEVDTKAAHPRIKITNKLVDHTCAITGLKRVSRPGLRRYVGAGEIPRVLGGMGTAILSTSRGIMSGREAKKQKVGGELLAYVW